MPTIDVIVETDSTLSIRARQVCGMFDCPPQSKQRRQWVASIPIDERSWSVGLIVGPSGSGKSTVAKYLWPNEIALQHEWKAASIIDDFDGRHSVEEIANTLSSVGFSTIPAWIRPFKVLSNGEQFRASIARHLIESSGVIVVDEFTSVVDRQVAKTACHCVQKYVRKNAKQFVAVSCHHDIEDWLQPDWVFRPETSEFQWRCLRRRPEIAIEVARLPYEAWRLFAPYHYLTSELNKTARCFGLWANGVLAAFVGVLHRPHPRVKNLKSVSRVVTLPDWQGVGLAFELLRIVGSAYKATGYRFCNYPAHPQFVRAHRPSEWRCRKRPGKATSAYSPKSSRLCKRTAKQRPCAVMEYIGSAMETAEARRLIG